MEGTATSHLLLLDLVALEVFGSASSGKSNSSDAQAGLELGMGRP
jgi:hypothetical protein